MSKNKTQAQIDKIRIRNKEYRERVKREKKANPTPEMSPERQKELIEEFLSKNEIVKQHPPFPEHENGRMYIGGYNELF